MVKEVKTKALHKLLKKFPKRFPLKIKNRPLKKGRFSYVNYPVRKY